LELLNHSALSEVLSFFSSSPESNLFSLLLKYPIVFRSGFGCTGNQHLSFPQADVFLLYCPPRAPHHNFFSLLKPPYRRSLSSTTDPTKVRGWSSRRNRLRRTRIFSSYCTKQAFPGLSDSPYLFLPPPRLSLLDRQPPTLDPPTKSVPRLIESRTFVTEWKP